MSGGYWDYQQYCLDSLNQDMRESYDEFMEQMKESYPEEASAIMQKYRLAMRSLIIAEVCIQRLDWLISGDDGYEAFDRRIIKGIYDQTQSHYQFMEGKEI